MRLSSSSEAIATASTSRSVKSAKFFTAALFPQFRIILNYIGCRGSPVKSGLAGFRQEFEQQPADLGRLLLLHPMAGAVDEMAAEHVRAAAPLHRLERAGALIGAPILLARDEA